MLVHEFMTREVVWCTPWETVRTAANLMKIHDVGVLPVVWTITDPLLEGIVTDRDLCCRVVAEGKHVDTVTVSEVMTLVPVTCKPDSTIEECAELMRENQVRRIPVVNDAGRCVGIVSQLNIARHATSAETAKTGRDISRPNKHEQEEPAERKYFYCGQTHEPDQILLLNRRRELHREVEVLQ